MNGLSWLEDYLARTMVTLCADTDASDVQNSPQAVESLGLFDALTPFERIDRAFGSGTVSQSREMPDAPETLRTSREHRYSLSRWPAFDFVILESEAGLAWGQAFVRRLGMVVPPLDVIADLTRWSHTKSEVLAALGPPASYEEWPPWFSALYIVGDLSFSLCFVFDLLQRVERLTRSGP